MKSYLTSQIVKFLFCLLPCATPIKTNDAPQSMPNQQTQQNFIVIPIAEATVEHKQTSGAEGEHENIDSVSQQDSNEITFSSFLKAVKQGDLPQVEHQFQPEFLTSLDKYGQPPLFVAIACVVESVWKHHFDIVKFLVEKGADVNFIEDSDFEGDSSLILATRFGQEKIVNFLIENNANVNYQSVVSNNALHEAAQFNGGVGFRMARALVRAEANVNAQHPSSFETPLMVAARGGRIHMVKYLVDCGADISLVDFNNDTALNWAEKRIPLSLGQRDVVSYFRFLLFKQGEGRESDYESSSFEEVNLEPDVPPTVEGQMSPDGFHCITM